MEGEETVITERISAASKEFVKIEVDPPVGVNPSSDALTFYFSPDPNDPGAVGAVNFTVNNSWTVTTDASGHPTYTARSLIGPGANVVAKGTWYVFLKITDNPTIPVKRATGQLEVF